MSKILLVPLLLGITFSASSTPPDYSSYDCNAPKIRALLIQGFNEVYKDAGIQSVDAFNQKTIEHGIGKLVCQGTYTLSSGEDYVYRFQIKPNSLGEEIIWFEPIETGDDE